MAAVALLAGFLAAPGSAAAHVLVDPISSSVGVTQLYIIVVPTEKRSDTIKVEVQFPRALVVLEIQAPAGWKVTPEKDGSGRILGAVWDGGNAPFEQFATFGVLAQNPNAPADLAWSAIQTFGDSSEVQWIGPENSQFPATMTRVRTPGAEVTVADYLAGGAVLLSIAALTLSVLIWRRLRQLESRHAPAQQTLSGRQH